MSKLARNKIARKALVGDSFSLIQTHVETTQVVYSQAHDREGGRQAGLDRPCIQTETTTACRVQQTTMHQHEQPRNCKEERQRLKHEHSRGWTICRLVVSRASVGKRAQRRLQEVAPPLRSTRGYPRNAPDCQDAIDVSSAIKSPSPWFGNKYDTRQLES